MTELEDMVAAMETGSLSLEDALKSYKRGMELAAYCQKTLASAEQQVKVLEDGQLKDFEPDMAENPAGQEASSPT